MVDTAAEITTVAQSVAHVKMYPQSKIISSKDVNVAAGACTSMTVGDWGGFIDIPDHGPPDVVRGRRDQV